MQRVRIWGLSMMAVGIAALAFPGFSWWPWSQDQTIEIATMLILGITAWAVMQYAQDSRLQTLSLSRRHIEPLLSQEEPVWSPGLQTNTIYYISSPDGSRVNARIRLKLWVGEEEVDYNGQVDLDGLHKGQRLWSLSGGQFRGVIEPGHALQRFVQERMSGDLTLRDLYDPDSTLAPENLRQLSEPKKIRAQVLVRFPKITSQHDAPEEQWALQPSSIYYLRWINAQRAVNGQTQEGYVWIPHPDAEDLPPRANEW